MTKLDQGVAVLTVAGVGAASAGALLLWGVGGGLLVLGLLLVVLGVLLGLG